MKWFTILSDATGIGDKLHGALFAAQPRPLAPGTHIVKVRETCEGGVLVGIPNADLTLAGALFRRWGVQAEPCAITPGAAAA